MDLTQWCFWCLIETDESSTTIEEEKFVQEMKEKKILKRIDGNVIKYSALICYPKKTAKSLRLLETEWNSSKRWTKTRDIYTTLRKNKEKKQQ